MSKRTIGADGLDEIQPKQYQFESERMRISREWKQITGAFIPTRIERLPIAEQIAALEFQKQRCQPVTETSGNDDSMMDFDNHKQH